MTVRSRKDDASPHIVLIDGANTLYRAFFALPPMHNAAGEPTNAVLGFANMLQKVIREEKPDWIAVVFDAPGKTFRHELYPEYKAGRDKQAEDLTAQFPVAQDLTAAFGFPVLIESGIEADDVIATVVANAPEQSTVTIVSTDKDLMQLVSDRVQLWDTMKDRRYGPAEVEARFGVRPEQLLDLRSLVGDPSDNIPGVKGIGEKGAAKLILEWGTLENLLEHAQEVTAKRAREALLEQAEQARLSKRLATLRSDVSLPCELGTLHAVEPDLELLRAKLSHLGFSRLIAKLDEQRGPAAAKLAPAEPTREAVACEMICDERALKEFITQLSEAEFVVMVPVLSETGFLSGGLVGLAIADEQGRSAYLALGHPREQSTEEPLEAATVLGALVALLGEDKATPWISSDAKALSAVLAEFGYDLPIADFDISLAAFLLNPSGRITIPALAAEYLGHSIREWEELAGRGAKAVPAAELPAEQVAAWAGEQVAAVAGLYPLLRMHLERDGLAALFDEVEMPLTAVLARLERAGVRIDEDLLASISIEYEGMLAKIEVEIFALAGEEFKVNSPKQLQGILFDKLGLSPLRKTKTGYSTDEGVLTELSRSHPLPERVLAYRHLAKLKSTYVDALPRLVNPGTGRIHPTFLQTGAATGRLACAHPNLQNIPIRTEEGARIRTAFIPAEGTRLLCADYSQVELRILAHYSGDPSLIEAFRSGEDIHRRTAAEVMGIEPEEVAPEDRAQAKAVNFGIIYGSSAFGLANQLGIPTYAAQQYIDDYFKRYKGVRIFLDATLETARKDGFVRTLLGRRRYLPDLASRNRTLRQAAERMAVNTVIQGTAADLIKKAMVQVDRRLTRECLSSRVILQVHDELVLEVPKQEESALRVLLTEEMEGVFRLKVPLRIDIGTGRNWREAH